MDAKTNSLNWFEISVTDIKRAKKFYESVFDIEMEETEMMGMQMAFFPAEGGSGKANGALVQSDQHKPSSDGAKIYLNANPDLTESLGKVEAAGGQVIMPKTDIGEDNGNMAFFIDTEGNVVGIHSQN
ncbi:MAG: VOC family protein [Chitinophagales bacterium]|nr:VOC family protein [Chitinophagales bacterium]